MLFRFDHPLFLSHTIQNLEIEPFKPLMFWKNKALKFESHTIPHFPTRFVYWYQSQKVFIGSFYLYVQKLTEIFKGFNLAFCLTPYWMG